MMRFAFVLLLACGPATVEPTTPEPEPIASETPIAPAPRFTGVVVGFDDACVLDEGTPICWGDAFALFDDDENAPRRLDLSGIRRIALGSGLTNCVLYRSGTLSCFGGINQEQRERENNAEIELLENMIATAYTDERVEELEREIAAVEARLFPMTLATDVRDVVLYDVGGCYLTDAVHCWDENHREADDDAPSEYVIGGDAEVLQLESASTHRCLLQADGRVRCWGDGDGLGWVDEDEEPDQPGLTAARDAVQIAVGEDFTCYRRDDGHVVCWGAIQDYLDAGDEEEDAYLPFEVPGIDDAEHIVAGGMHACAIRAAGRVTCWGDNSLGALGNGSIEPIRTPVDVPALSPAREVAAGQDATCALVGEELRCLGSNRYGVFGTNDANTPQLFPLRGTRVLTPGRRTCIEANGQLQCTGDVAGRLASNLAPRPFDDDDRAIDQLDAYIGYECLLRGSELVCSSRGRNPRTLPDISMVSVGTTSVCAIDRARRVSCWRQRPESQSYRDLLNRNAEPTRIPGVERAESIAVGDVHACIVRADGKVVCWGDNMRGLIQTPSGDLNAPVVLEGVQDAVQLSLNRTSTCVRKRDQTVVCRGSDAFSELPVRDVVDIATQGHERYLLTRDGRVHRMRGMTLFDPVELPAEIVELSAGTAHTCARARDGRTWCWGVGESGELGVLPTWIHLQPHTVQLP